MAIWNAQVHYPCSRNATHPFSSMMGLPTEDTQKTGEDMLLSPHGEVYYGLKAINSPAQPSPALMHPQEYLHPNKPPYSLISAAEASTPRPVKKTQNTEHWGGEGWSRELSDTEAALGPNPSCDSSPTVWRLCLLLSQAFPFEFDVLWILLVAGLSLYCSIAWFSN